MTNKAINDYYTNIITCIVCAIINEVIKCNSFDNQHVEEDLRLNVPIVNNRFI